MLIEKLFESIAPFNKELLNELLDDQCLYINHDQKAYIDKSKILNALHLFQQNFAIKKLHILNMVKDAEDTYLISYNAETDGNVLFGGMVIRLNDKSIFNIKHFIVK